MSVRAPFFSTKQGAISAAMAASSTVSPCRWLPPAPQAAGADQRHVAALREIADQRLVYSRATVASVPSTDTSLVCASRAGRLDGGNRCRRRQREAPPQFGEHQVEAVLHAITIRFGSNRPIRSPITSITRADKSPSHPAAIGERGVVGGIDVLRVRPHRGDLAENGEAAEAGIENQNGRCVVSRVVRSGVTARFR
jgi:hypothetical protein